MNIKRIIDRYRNLPNVSFCDKMRFAMWKYLFRKLQMRHVLDGTGQLVNARFAKESSPTPSVTYKRLVFVCGFGWSGSGAVHDLIMEYAPVTGFPAEFNLARAAGGVFGFERAFTTNNIFERDAALRVFMALIDNIYVSTKKCYGEEFLHETKTFLEGLIDYITCSAEPFEHCPHLAALGTRAIFRIFGDASDVSGNATFFLKELSVAEYRKRASAYLNRILNQIEVPDYLLIDQGCADCSADMERFADYFGSFKAIYTYRDPRDVFASANLARRRGEKRGHVPSDPLIFVKWYNRALAPFNGLHHPNLMLLRFEDLVVDTESTVSQIESFLGLSPSDHTTPHTRFIPEESCAVSMGLWKDEPDQAAIRHIEEHLSQYCYTKAYTQPGRLSCSSTGVMA